MCRHATAEAPDKRTAAGGQPALARNLSRTANREYRKFQALSRNRLPFAPGVSSNPKIIDPQDHDFPL
jgi:hypothetical protein